LLMVVLYGYITDGDHKKKADELKNKYECTIDQKLTDAAA